MADAISADQLRKEADHLGVQFRVKGKDLLIKMPATRTPAAEAFRKRLIAAKPIIVASSGSPKIIKDAVKKASNDNWLSKTNGFVNALRDKYVTPPVEAAGGFIGRHSWLADLPGIKTPEDASKLGAGIGREAEKTIIPDSVTGKGINAALALTGGESAEAEEGLGALRSALGSTRGRIGVPALVGGVAGGASGEGFGSGVLQGAGAGAAGELPRPFQKAKQGRDLFKAAELQYRKDDLDAGVKLSPVLRLKSFDEQLAKYKNWVRALKDGRVQREAGQRFAGGMDDLATAVKDYSTQKAQEIFRDFKAKLKMPFNKDAKNPNGPIYAEFKAMKEEATAIRDKGRQIFNAMKTTRRLQSQVFDRMGNPKGGPTAIDASKELEMTKSLLRDKLREINPAFRGTYDQLNEEYRMFGALRQIADSKEAINPISGHVDLDAINHELDANPRRYQSRLGDDNFDQLRSVFRRGAGPAPDYTKGEAFFDQPGELGRMRAIMYGAKGHVATTAETVGNVAGGAPLTTRLVGVKKVPTVPGRIPRLITGAATNEGEEKIRDAINSGQQQGNDQP